MVSLSCHSDRRRRIRQKTAGKANRKALVRAGTPRFPIHPVGYDATAADAKKA